MKEENEVKGLILLLVLFGLMGIVTVIITFVKSEFIYIILVVLTTVYIITALSFFVGGIKEVLKESRGE